MNDEMSEPNMTYVTRGGYSCPYRAPVGYELKLLGVTDPRVAITSTEWEGFVTVAVAKDFAENLRVAEQLVRYLPDVAAATSPRKGRDDEVS